MDDILVVSASKLSIAEVKNKLCARFYIKDKGHPKSFLGIEIEMVNNVMFLSQKTFIKKIICRYNLEDLIPVGLPIEKGLKLPRSDSVNVNANILYSILE